MTEIDRGITDNTPKICVICGNDKIKYQCVDCYVFWCEKCYQRTNHKKWRNAYKCCKCDNVRIEKKWLRRKEE